MAEGSGGGIYERLQELAALIEGVGKPVRREGVGGSEGSGLLGENPRVTAGDTRLLAKYGVTSETFRLNDYNAIRAHLEAEYQRLADELPPSAEGLTVAEQARLGIAGGGQNKGLPFSELLQEARELRQELDASSNDYARATSDIRDLDELIAHLESGRDTLPGGVHPATVVAQIEVPFRQHIFTQRDKAEAAAAAAKAKEEGREEFLNRESVSYGETDADGERVVTVRDSTGKIIEERKEPDPFARPPDDPDNPDSLDAQVIREVSKIFDSMTSAEYNSFVQDPDAAMLLIAQRAKQTADLLRGDERNADYQLGANVTTQIAQWVLRGNFNQQMAARAKAYQGRVAMGNFDLIGDPIQSSTLGLSTVAGGLAKDLSEGKITYDQAQSLWGGSVRMASTFAGGDIPTFDPEAVLSGLVGLPFADAQRAIDSYIQDSQFRQGLGQRESEFSRNIGQRESEFSRNIGQRESEFSRNIGQRESEFARQQVQRQAEFIGTQELDFAKLLTANAGGLPPPTPGAKLGGSNIYESLTAGVGGTDPGFSEIGGSVNAPDFESALRRRTAPEE